MEKTIPYRLRDLTPGTRFEYHGEEWITTDYINKEKDVRGIVCLSPEKIGVYKQVYCDFKVYNVLQD